MRKAFPATVLVLAAAIHLWGASLAGVTLPDTSQVGTKTLVLNGIGLRTRLMFKVYVAGLYVDQKTSDAAAILAANAPRRIVMQFLRDVSRDQMADALRESFESNNPDAATLKADIDKLLSGFEPLRTGDQVVFTYQPEVGTTLAIRGKDRVTIPGAAFGRAMFACWLGPSPPSSDLKNKLLGK
jgi:hypothetical protein